jgi:protein-arginine kinase activator protein McsA
MAIKKIPQSPLTESCTSCSTKEGVQAFSISSGGHTSVVIALCDSCATELYQLSGNRDQDGYSRNLEGKPCADCCRYLMCNADEITHDYNCPGCGL